MSRQNRTTLKGYFITGARPTEDHFADLIDSCLNFTDDGMDVDETNGNVGIGTQNPQARLHVTGGQDVRLDGVSGYLIVGEADNDHIAIDNNKIMAKANATTATTLNLQADEGDLIIGSGNPQIKVGIGIGKPQAQLHVRGEHDPTIKIQSNGTNEISGRLALRQSNESGADIYYDGTSEIEGLRIDLRAGSRIKPTALFVSNHAGRVDNVGIGTTSPSAPLEIVRDVAEGAETNMLQLRSSNDGLNTKTKITFVNGTSDEKEGALTEILSEKFNYGGPLKDESHLKIRCQRGAEMEDIMTIHSGGIAIKKQPSHPMFLTYTLELDGNVKFFEGDLDCQDITCRNLRYMELTQRGSSDIRLKKDIKPFKDGLELLKQVNPVNFKFNGKAGFTDDKPQIGVIAQEIEPLFPYMVDKYNEKLEPSDTEATELLRVDNKPLVYILINAVKELSERLESIENHMNLSVADT